MEISIIKIILNARLVKFIKTLLIEDKDIVLATVQSLSMAVYPENTFESFGLASI